MPKAKEPSQFKRSALPTDASRRGTEASVLLAEEVYRLVVRAKKHLWLTSARALEARGESVFTWQVLCWLVRNGPSAQRDLANSTAQHPAGLSRLVEELEEKKLVRRKVDPHDRRRQLVDVTAKGKAWVERMRPDVFSAADRALAPLSEDDRRVLRALLLELLAPVGDTLL